MINTIQQAAQAAVMLELRRNNLHSVGVHAVMYIQYFISDGRSQTISTTTTTTMMILLQSVVVVLIAQ